MKECYRMPVLTSLDFMKDVVSSLLLRKLLWAVHSTRGLCRSGSHCRWRFRCVDSSLTKSTEVFPGISTALFLGLVWFVSWLVVIKKGYGGLRVSFIWSHSILLLPLSGPSDEFIKKTKYHVWFLVQRNLLMSTLTGVEMSDTISYHSLFYTVSSLNFPIEMDNENVWR